MFLWQTDGPTDGQTDRQRDRQTDRQMDEWDLMSPCFRESGGQKLWDIAVHKSNVLALLPEVKHHANDDVVTSLYIFGVTIFIVIARSMEYTTALISWHRRYLTCLWFILLLWSRIFHTNSDTYVCNVFSCRCYRLRDRLTEHYIGTLPYSGRYIHTCSHIRRPTSVPVCMAFPYRCILLL